ncbi:MAG: NAD(+) kinase [Moraxella sp.]|nr:NAD(+) kinase [Moraxella sp.]
MKLSQAAVLPQEPLFYAVGLMGRAGKSSVAITLSQIAHLLMRLNRLVVMDTDTVSIAGLDIDFSRVKVVDKSDIAHKVDLVIVVGGDGSILQAAQTFVGTNIPVFGVNRGRLGFLADVSPQDVETKLQEVLNGSYQLDERFLLLMQIIDGESVVHEDVALNDVVLHAGKSVHAIDFQLKINGIDVYRQHADGLIVSTPTGSTAYALSAGGPIIHPSLDAICLAPMHPHTLSSRPIVVSSDSHITIRVHRDNRTQPMVSPDGKMSMPLHSRQVLSIKKSTDSLVLLHPVGFDFYESCRTKLNWSLYSDEFALEGDGSFG